MNNSSEISKNKKTTVGIIHEEVLAYTAGDDVLLDLHLVRMDCIGIVFLKKYIV